MLGLREAMLCLRHNLFSVDYLFVLTAALRQLTTAGVTSRRPVTISKVVPSDMEDLRYAMRGLPARERKEILVRLIFYEQGFTDCYIARAADQTPAAVQWLLSSHDDDRLQQLYPHRFYPVRSRHVVIENAFVLPSFRGVGIYRLMTSHLIQQAIQMGATHAHSYILKEKVSSLNLMVAYGFRIRKLVRETKLLGITRRAL